MLVEGGRNEGWEWAYADDGDFLDVLRFRHCIYGSMDNRAWLYCDVGLKFKY